MHLSRYRSSFCKAVLSLPHSHDSKGDARLRGVEGRAHKEVYDSPQQPVQYGKPTVHRVQAPPKKRPLYDMLWLLGNGKMPGGDKK